MSLYTHPSFEEIRQLFPPKNPAITIYITFNKAMSSADKKQKSLSKLKGVLRTLPMSYFNSKDERAKFENTVTENVDEKLKSLAGYGNSYAIFASEDLTLAYDVPNRLISYSGVSDNFFIQPILRAFAFSFEGYLLIAGKDNWELYYASNTDEIHKVEIDKTGVTSVLDAANKLNDVKHQIQRSVKDTLKDALSMYAKRVAERVKTKVNGHELLIVADTTLLAELKAQFAHSGKAPMTLAKSMNPHTPLHELDSLLRTSLAAKHEADVQELFKAIDMRRSQGRVLSDLSDIAIAAVAGRVDTLILPYNASVSGDMDMATGKIDFNGNGDLLHSIVVAVAEHKGLILAFREEEMQYDMNGDHMLASLRF
jgi:hypothetical protein